MPACACAQSGEANPAPQSAETPTRPSGKQTLRLATWNAALSRKGPGLLLRDIGKADGGDPDAQIAAAVQVIVALDADVLVLTGMDYDHGGTALDAFAALLAARGSAYPHRIALRPNSGIATGLDLDGDGRRGGPGDAQGFGFFPGQKGMAVLSRLPLQAGAARDLSALLWRDLPDAIPPPLPAEVAGVQRLSSGGHWIVPVALPGGRDLSLLIWYATPPVFDGPEDRNGRRNHDEAALWLRLLEGRLSLDGQRLTPPAAPFVLIGDANLDPMDGEGRPAALTALLSHPELQDPAPRGSHGRVEPGDKGDPGLDTAFHERSGGLRLDYILPSRGLVIRGAGVLWPEDGAALAALLKTASPHRPVWVDIALPVD